MNAEKSTTNKKECQRASCEPALPFIVQQKTQPLSHSVMTSSVQINGACMIQTHYHAMLTLNNKVQAIFEVLFFTSQ